MFQTVDFKINVSPGATSLSELRAINDELERMIALQKQSSNFNGGGGGGGGGGGNGGGGGGGNGNNNIGNGGGGGTSGSASVNAANAAGMSRPATGDSFYAQFAKSGGGGDEDQGMTHEQLAAKRLKKWQATMGIQAIGYGLEDFYYSGARGALNNLPFAAQGLAAMTGMNSKVVDNVAGVAALVGTAGMVAYDNREEMSKKMGYKLGKREDNLFGLPGLNDSQEAQKRINDSMYYVNKYGEKSDSGGRYQAQAIKGMVELEAAKARSTSESEIARVRSLPSVGSAAAGEALNQTGLGGDRLTSYLSRNPKGATQEQIMTQLKSINAESTFSPISNLFGFKSENMDMGNYGKAKEAADSIARTSSDKSASQISRAMSGDATAIEALKKDLADNKLSGRDRTMAESVMKMGKMSSYDANQISSLRSSSANPYANLSQIDSQIGGYMKSSGVSEEDSKDFRGANMEEMQEKKKRAPYSWQKNLDANRSRYEENIAASFGGMEASGSRGNSGATQRNNLKKQIYSDLLAQGVPRDQASREANRLYGAGQTAYQGMKKDAQGMQNGASTMENMMFAMGDEQQMAFGQFQQNRIQIQMHQSMLRRQAMMRSRYGLRGMR